MLGIKNWDNKTWISSREYIKSFNNFIIKQKKLNKESKILDIGCGRGKIIGSLSTKLKLKNKPIGLDIENHKDKDKRIIFKKISAIKYLKKNKKKFDLILIKQTIHLLKRSQILKLIKLCKKHLSQNGNIFILSLDYNYNEIPTFELMNNKLQNSLKRDKKILTMLQNDNENSKMKRFIYTVKISKKKYLQMIMDRYISTLLTFKIFEIKKGVSEIKSNYKDIIKFKDKLLCLILS